MIQVSFLIILLSLETLTADSDIIKGDSCMTPHQENGTCQRLSKCDAIELAYDAIPEKAAKQFITDSECNCSNGKVCCASLYNFNITYPPLINCVPVPEEEKIAFSSISDSTICGLDKLTDKIQGGTIANVGEHPWIAALEYKSKVNNASEIKCGGSIINQKYILTAAHCVVEHVEFVLIKAWLGVSNTSSEEYCWNNKGKPECVNTVQKIDIEDTIPHQFYNSINHTDDIGLLRLKDSIEYSDYIRPICLPSSDYVTPRIGTLMTVAGWGATEFRGTTSNIKLKVDLPVQDDSMCNKFLESDRIMLSSKQLCVGGESRKDSCQGDSGGPLMKNFRNTNDDPQWYQGGIVSYGSACGTKGHPGIYTKVSSYIKWIFNTINHLTTNLGRDEPCTTPNGTIGTCAPINTCELVFKATYTKNDDTHSFAKESYCGYDNESLVCCESPGPIILPNFNTTALPNKTTCGLGPEEQPRIRGGEIADLGEFPWAVAIEYKSRIDERNGGLSCGGSIINNRYILTAAHCLIDIEFEPITVWVGDWNTTTDPDCKEFVANVECAEPVQKILIKKIIPHIFFDRIKKQNNIGLILLENDIKFSAYVSPICLPLSNLAPLELGIRMTVVGWGFTENYTTSVILRKIEIPLVSNEICNMILEQEQISINSQQLCSVGAEGTKGGCEGDSGGPLMSIHEDKATGRIHWYQDGLVSFGSPCRSRRRLDIYTRVASYADWIINIISED